MQMANEAKANFSGLLFEVELGLVSFTIMRYGRPVARVVPVEQTRKIRPNFRLWAKDCCQRGCLCR